MKLILFDLDNTLFNFKDCWEYALTRLFDHFELEVDIEIFKNKFIEYDLKYWTIYENGECDIDYLRNKRLMDTLKDFNININYEDATMYFNVFFNYVIEYIKPNVKNIELLKNLKSKYKLGILTNGKILEQKRKINSLNLNTIFEEDEIFISEKIGYEKPDKKAFKYVLDKLNVEPENTIYVGDSIRNDVKGALNTGIKAVWFNVEYLKSENKDFFQISRLQDLELVLSEL